MIVTASAHARHLQSVAKKLDCDLPAPFLAALDTARQLIDTTDKLGGESGAINARAVTLLLDGKNPVVDPELQRLITARALAEGGIRYAGAERAADLITDAINTHADTILAAWSAELAEDYAALDRAGDKLSATTNLDTAEPLAMKRAGHLAVWSEALTAADRVRIAAEGFQAIAAALHLQYQPEHQPLALTAAPLGDVEAAQRLAASEGRDPDAWTLARVGAPLALATVAEFMERIAVLTAARQARHKAREDAQQHAGFDGVRPGDREALGI